MGGVPLDYRPRSGRVPDAGARRAVRGGIPSPASDVMPANLTPSVWGSGAFDGQTAHRDHVLADGDIVEIHE